MIKDNLKKLFDKIESRLFQSDKFHLYSNNKNMGNFDLREIPEQWVKIHFKTYPRLPKIYLPSLIKQSHFSKILEARFSARNFSPKPISKDKLFYLIHEAAGLTRFGKSFDNSRRTYPSAGARYPLELYLVILNCESLKKGLYHYNVKENCLEQLLGKDLKNWVVEVTGKQEWIRNAAVIFIITGVLDRTRVKYGERGYRYVLMEIGHLGQNIQLLSTEQDLGSCVIGGYVDSEVNKLLDINLQKEVTLYLIAVGNI